MNSKFMLLLLNMETQSTPVLTRFSGFILMIVMGLSLPAVAGDWISVSFSTPVQGPLYQNYKLEQIKSFIQKVKKNIPPSFQQQIFSHQIDLIFQEDLSRDALFYPPTKKSNAKILIDAKLYFHPQINTLLAHEIFHAIHFVLNPDEEVWIREGLAQYFEFIMTGKPNGVNITQALMEISTPLNGEYDLKHANRAQYGHGLLYFYYIINKCGGEKLFWKLVAAGPRGGEQIDSVLRSQRDSTSAACQGFHESVVNFEISRVVNRVLYQQNEPHLFSLIPTSQRVKAKNSIVKNCQLRPLTPIFLTTTAFLQSNLDTRQVDLFYIQSNYPYSVAKEAAPVSANWNVLLIPAATFKIADYCQR